MRSILVVEDKQNEWDCAFLAVGKAGYVAQRASNLCEALREIDQHDAVLTDLFFPHGSHPTPDEYVKRFLPLYQAYRERRFEILDEKDDVLARVIRQCAELFNMTTDQYVEDVISQWGMPERVTQSARDAVEGYKDSSERDKFLRMEERVEKGYDLPLGIVVAERAQELGKPCVVVTSTYHHDDAFEPVAHLVPSYIDAVVNGRKDWENGIALLEHTMDRR